MENQEKKLQNLFQQLGTKNETLETPDLRIKNAVFSTIDSASLVADIIDLFTSKFIQAQSEVVHNISEDDYESEKKRFFKSFGRKQKRD